LVLATQKRDGITGRRTRLRADGKTLGDRTRGTMNFDIKTEQLGDDAYVISLAGEVDLYTAPEFKQQLLEVIGQGGKQVIVDFSDTTFIDSTTLGVLVGGVKRLRTNDGQLSLVCSDRNITKIFEITGLDRVFTIYPTREEALAQVKSTDKPPA
jgi:anti-sigma B factor antagonist